MGESLVQLLRLEGFVVEWHRSAAAAEVALAARRYSLVLSDIRLPDRDGGDLFLGLKARHVALPPVMFMTAWGTIDRAVELLKSGAADYITKPFDVDQLLLKVRTLAEAHGTVSPEGDDSLGRAPAMRRIAASLPRLAHHAATLLITGESGSGKEHIARLFHQHAGGNEENFVAVNCASIPESLMEAELFGYERGAFTGAAKAKRGYIEQADGGSLFLDEIGEMPLSMQAKLLRVLQDGQFVRLGSDRPLRSQFRLVCATHRDLKAMAANGLFREDLYYRIHVIDIPVPPLRERPEDIRWLVYRFLDDFNQRYPGAARRIDPRTEQALVSYLWPGNVRELKHAVERACILCAEPLLEAEAFFGAEAVKDVELPDASPTLADYLMSCEREFLTRALDRHNGHMTHTAEALGITRKTLWEKLRRLGLNTRAEP